MKSQKGFTLIELIVVVAIVGVLVTTAFPTYKIFRQRAIGSEVIVLMKQILDAEIIYYLEENQFFPPATPPGAPPVIAWVPIDAEPGHPAANAIKQALNIAIPVGHHYDVMIMNTGNTVQVSITAPFPIFKNNTFVLARELDQSGKIRPL
jgi:prepilin-type N-terminal cleavage/methylation domain-containing protein